MKTILEFLDEDEDDQYKLKRCQKSLDLYLALWTLSSRFRDIRKHGGDPVSEKEFYEILEKYDLDLDDLGI